MIKHKGALYLWTDGIHFIRPAVARDRHLMRFVVGSHKTTASTYKRHAPTLDEAIGAAQAATKLWLTKHPLDASFLTGGATPPPEASAKEPPKIDLPPFATTLFDCIYANPVAQVWQCTRWPGEHKPVGRRRAGGAAAKQTAVPHVVGDCAVMQGSEPLRTPAGDVVVFGTWGEAEEVAVGLYENTPEEDTISWKSGDKRVGETLNLVIIFDPGVNSVTRPFNLYLPRFNRPVYADTTRQTMVKEGVNPAGIESAQLRMDLETARARARAEDRQPAFEEKTLLFRSIWAAYEEADRREKMLRGEPVR